MKGMRCVMLLQAVRHTRNWWEWVEVGLAVGLMALYIMHAALAQQPMVQGLMWITAAAWGGQAFLRWHMGERRLIEFPPMDLAEAHQLQEAVNQAVHRFEQHVREGEEQ